jgi:hypothetical protein
MNEMFHNFLSNQLICQNRTEKTDFIGTLIYNSLNTLFLWALYFISVRTQPLKYSRFRFRNGKSVMNSSLLKYGYKNVDNIRIIYEYIIYMGE